MDLAPLATTVNAMLADLPFAIAEELDPGAVHEQVEWTVGTAIRDLDTQGFDGLTRPHRGHGPISLCRRHSVE